MSPGRATAGDDTNGRTAGRPDTSIADPAPGHIVDPRAVRVSLGQLSAHAELAPIVVQPPAVPLAPARHIAGSGILGGVAVPALGFGPEDVGDQGIVVVDGEPMHVRLDRLGPVHGVLTDGDPKPGRTSVLLLPLERASSGSGTPGQGGSMRPRPSGIERQEVVVDGWRVEVEVESDRRASLRERARRGREESDRGGPTEVHAIIPGVVVSVSVVAGDAVVAGQQLLVVEAMKMQNELRAPRDGVISRVAIGAGRTIEVGDLLLVLE